MIEKKKRAEAVLTAERHHLRAIEADAGEAELRGQAILNKRSRHLYGGRIIYQKLHSILTIRITKMELPPLLFCC